MVRLRAQRGGRTCARHRSANEGSEGLQDPYEQAKDYARFIRNFTEGMHDENAVAILPVAYLHNCTSASARSLFAADWERERHVFVGDYESEEAFVLLLKESFASDREHAIAGRRLIEAKYQQGPGLLSAASELLTDPDNFPLTPEQREIFAKIQDRVHRALSPAADRGRAVIVVKGGPGTGKTWIAMHLVGANARAQRQIAYATNSSALRKALCRTARLGMQAIDRPVNALMTSARTYHSEDRWADPLDVMVVDEAHRIEKYTVTTGHSNPRQRQEHIETNAVTQLYELHKSARVVILLIDEDQSITPADDCTVGHPTYGASCRRFVRGIRADRAASVRRQ